MDTIDKIEASAFSPLIFDCISSIHGGLDLISRGLINSIDKNNFNNEQIDQIFAKSTLKNQVNTIFYNNPSKTPLFGQLQLGSLQTDKLEIDIDKISDLIFERKFYPENIIHQATRILIVTSYEYTKVCKDKSQIWEFFRHVRNAAGHGGIFNFSSWIDKKTKMKIEEPVRPAEWNNIKVTRLLQGKELFINTKKGEGIIYAGDFILMLLELENKYPDIKKIKFS